MHEYSLISGVMEAVLAEALKHSFSRVTRVCLVVGEAYGALPEALEFAFGALCRGTIMEGSLLEIVEDPLLCSCQDCSVQFSWAKHQWQCPLCGGMAAQIEGGRDIRIDYFEGEEEDG